MRPRILEVMLAKSVIFARFISTSKGQYLILSGTAQENDVFRKRCLKNAKHFTGRGANERNHVAS